MKKILFLLLLGVFQIFSAQVEKKVKLQYTLNPLGNDTYEAVVTANIENGWHVYSNSIDPSSGAIATELKINSKNIQLIGKVQETGKKETDFSEAFQADLTYLSGKAVFKQKFKIKDPNKGANVTAEFTYQTCNDRVCLAPETIEFEKNIEGSEGTAENASVQNKDSLIDPQNSNVNKTSSEDTKQEGLRVNSIDFMNPLTNCGTVQNEEKNTNLWILVLGFLGGLIALLTPCVFPMIPLTVSFFTKGQKDKAKGRREAIIYGLFILVIFVMLSIPFHLIDGISGNIFNQISTNIWLNIFFFAIFLFFALSFFGYYDLTLPSWIANRSSKAEEAGGLVGIFFMALTLVIVSFSCTGPILGSLLGGVASSSQNVPLLLTFALAGFGLSWALVFGLLALFPQALQSLPKSGGWMNTVKVVLGFIELALALKFLSKADLVSKTFLLKRELFIGLWIIITLCLVLYLFGKIRFPHDNKNEKPSLTRKLIGVLGIGFVIYLIQGLFPAERPKLQALSGILPPVNVSYFQDENDGILGMHPEHDYFKAIALAKKENKPVLIDFTGYGCENCRKMEEFVWSEPDILPLLQNEIVLASLYVDDKEELPASEQTKIDMGNGQMKRIKTIGDKWSMFQQVNFNNNSQPHYVMVTPEGKVINTPVSGYMSKEDFKKFLICGIEFYRNQIK